MGHSESALASLCCRGNFLAVCNDNIVLVPSFLMESYF